MLSRPTTGGVRLVAHRAGNRPPQGDWSCGNGLQLETYPVVPWGIDIYRDDTTVADGGRGSPCSEHDEKLAPQNRQRGSFRFNRLPAKTTTMRTQIVQTATRIWSTPMALR